MAINVAAALDSALDDLVGRNKGGGKGKRVRDRASKGKGQGKKKEKRAAGGVEQPKKSAETKAAASEKQTQKSALGAAKQLDMSLEDIVKSQVRRKTEKAGGKGDSKKSVGKAGKKLWAGAAKVGGDRSKKGKVKKTIAKNKDAWADSSWKGGGKGGGKGYKSDRNEGKKWGGKGDSWSGSERKVSWGGKGDSWRGGGDSWGKGQRKGASWEQNSWGKRNSGGASWEPSSWSSSKKDDSWDRETSRGGASWGRKNEDWDRKDSGRSSWKDSGRDSDDFRGSSRGETSRGGSDWDRRGEKRSYQEERTDRGSRSTGSRKIKVTNIPRDLNKVDIREAFEREAGKIAHMDFERGAASIEFTNTKDARRAVDTFDGGELNGKIIEVVFER